MRIQLRQRSYSYLFLLLSSGSVSHCEPDEETHHKTCYYGGNAIGAHTVGRACETEVVRNPGAKDHSEGKDGGIAVSFTCQKQLTARTAASQCESQARKDHPPEIP